MSLQAHQSHQIVDGCTRWTNFVMQTLTFVTSMRVNVAIVDSMSAAAIGRLHTELWMIHITQNLFAGLTENCAPTNCEVCWVSNHVISPNNLKHACREELYLH